MRTFTSKLLLSAAVLTLGVSAASAADLPARTSVPYTKAPVMMAAYDWSGFYVGINGGGAVSRIDWNADGLGDEGHHNASGGTFGGQVGYRWQMMPSWVFGVEAQGNWADLKGSNVSAIFNPNVNQTKVDAFGLFTGQIGYAVDRTLLYVKGGAAVTDNRYQIFFAAPGGALLNGVSETRWGATIGAGIEYAFAPGWSAGFEYNHLFMGNNDIVQGPGFVNDHIQQDIDIFTARVNYKFGGPVVARY